MPVVQPRAQSVADYMVVTGNAAAVNTVKLVARVEGYLEKIHYEDGQFVRKGDLLFTIQQDQYKDQLQQAQGQVLSAQAALKHANTELPRYSALVKKMRQLRPRSTSGFTKKEAPRGHCFPPRRRSRWTS